MSPTDNTLKNPTTFSQKLDSLKQQLPPILDDYNKYYVLYNTNPDYNEYQQSFASIQGNLNQLNSQLFTLSNEVQTSTNDINQILFELNTLISYEKKRNSYLNRQLKNIQSDNYATNEMIINYKEMYSEGYLRNWGLLLSIIFAGLVIKKVYSAKLLNPIPI